METATFQGDENHAIQRIEGLLGSVQRDEVRPGRPVVSVSLNYAVVEELVCLNNLPELPPAMDADMKAICCLKSLETLDLSYTHVSDVGLQELACLHDLRSLGLRGTKVTDAGCRALACFRRLSNLDLHRTKVTDAGLKDLACLHCLESLDLSATQLTGATFKDMARLSNLGRLVLPSIPGAAYRDLACLGKLEELLLIFGALTDADLVAIAHLENLRYLSLESGRITNGGLHELAALRHLKSLHVFCTTQVAVLSIAELQTYLPECKIRLHGP